MGALSVLFVIDHVYFLIVFGNNNIRKYWQITFDSAESTELKLLRETITSKDVEIERLTQDNVRMIKEIEVLTDIVAFLKSFSINCQKINF